MTDRLIEEIIDVLEAFAYAPYVEYDAGHRVFALPRRLPPSEDSILRAQALVEKLKGAIRD